MGVRLVPYLRNRLTQPERGDRHNSLVELLVIEEYVVVLMVVFQDLKQGSVSLGTGPWKSVGAQNRGREPRRCREKGPGNVQGGNFGSRRLGSSEKVVDGSGHGPSLRNLGGVGKRGNGDITGNYTQVRRRTMVTVAVTVQSWMALIVSPSPRLPPLTPDPKAG